MRFRRGLVVTVAVAAGLPLVLFSASQPSVTGRTCRVGEPGASGCGYLHEIPESSDLRSARSVAASTTSAPSPASTLLATGSPAPATAVTITPALTIKPTPTTKPAVTTKPVTPGISKSAPTTTAGGPTIAGCALFPADNAWRENISTLPVAPQSNAWVASIGSSFLHPDFGTQYGIPYITVPAGQPKVPITFTAYGDESDPGPYPIPVNAPIESGSDHHVLVASGDCHLYELYDASKDTSGSGWSAESGAVFNLNSDALRPVGWTSADAAGLPILPGLVRRDEVASGVIRHALRFTVARTQAGYIAPATHFASSSTDPNLPPMGARFRLKASFDISGYTGQARVIVQALKTYGMFVADNGSNWFLSGANDPGWNDDDLEQLKTVPGSAFEAVQTGPIQTG